MNDINAIKIRDVNVSAYRHCLSILHSKKHFVFVLKTIPVKIFVLNF